MTAGGHVLVTGAGGFIGRHLVQSLLDEGAGVRALVRTIPDLAPSGWASVDLVEGDVAAEDTIRHLCRNVDRVFHLAATQSFGVSRAQVLDVNAGATERLCRRALESGVRRFVLVSSGGVHANETGAPVTEAAPFGPSNVYFESKAQAEAAAREVFRDAPERLCIVRPGAVYGPGCRRLLQLFRNVAHKRFVMIGPGTRMIHPVYVDDLVNALLAAGVTEHGGEVFLASGPEAMTLREWVAAIAGAAGVDRSGWNLPLGPVMLAAPVCEGACRLLGIAPPLSRRRLGYFTRHRHYDLTKARRLLGYEPEVDCAEGARRTVRWYRSHGWL